MLQQLKVMKGWVGLMSSTSRDMSSVCFAALRLPNQDAQIILSLRSVLERVTLGFVTSYGFEIGHRIRMYYIMYSLPSRTLVANCTMHPSDQG